jgi:hypothetical protein
MTEAVSNSVIEFLSNLEDLPFDTMFRGQSDSSWPLVPSISRFAKYVQGGYDSIAGLEEHLLEKFVQYSVPYKDLRTTKQLERLVYCQHYGLPTRLLDWSTNPLKGLFFAVEDTGYDGVDGRVHVLFPKSWWEGVDTVGTEIDTLTAIYPEFLHVRVIAQDACFTAFPLSEIDMEVGELSHKNYGDSIDKFFSVLIPKESKGLIRRQLAGMGIGYQTLFPGPDGVAKSVKSILSNFSV